MVKQKAVGIHRFGSIEEINRKFAAQELSPVEILGAAYQEISERNGAVNAIVTEMREQATSAANASGERFRKGRSLGLMDGIPVCVKDAFAVEGIRFTSGSSLFANRLGEDDAGVVKALKAAGAVILGKSNLAELTLGLTSVNPLFGRTANPLCAELDAGGSSAGDAAAVGCGFVKLGVGSDLGGSLRIPAAWCGLYSVKPTPGVVPTDGHFPDAWNGIAVAGAIGASARDLRIGLESLSRFSEADSASVPARLTSGRFRTRRYAAAISIGGVGIDRPVLEALEATLTQLDGLGYRRMHPDLSVLDRKLDFFWDLASGHGGDPEGTRALIQNFEFLGSGLREFLTVAGTHPATLEGFARAEAARHMDMRRLHRLFADIDLIVTVSSPVAAQPSGTNAVEIDGRSSHIFEAHVYCWIFSLLGVPCVNVPVALANGLSAGVQLVGPRFSDWDLLALADELNARVST